MRQKPENENRSCANSCGLEDAKASGPASSDNVLQQALQLERTDCAVAPATQRPLEPQVRSPEEMNGTRLPVLLRELSSGSFGQFWFDEFSLKLFREVGENIVILDDVELTRLEAQLDNAGIRNVRRPTLKRTINLLAKDCPPSAPMAQI